MKLKRIFDIVFSVLGLLILSAVIFLLIIISAVDTSSSGIFRQKRIGQFGKSFLILKIRSVIITSTQISKFGRFIRNSKLDELPQLINILKGEMSFVGPRPDISGYYDELKGDDRKVLELKPGLTSEASLKYSDEENILKNQKNPLKYNDEFIFPDKVKMNLEYYYSQTLLLDLKIIFKTIFR